MCKISADDWIAIGTVALALATIALVGVTIWLARVAKKQWISFKDAETRATNSDIANRDSRQQELRAYVYVETVSNYIYIPPDEPKFELVGNVKINLSPKFLIEVKNFGKTPGFKASIWSAVRVAPIDPLPSFTGIDIQKPGAISTLPPGGGFSHEALMTIPTAITIEEVRGLVGGTHAIYVYGCFVYRDSFTKNRISTFKYRYVGEDAVAVLRSTTAARAMVCENGNEEFEYDPTNAIESLPI